MMRALPLLLLALCGCAVDCTDADWPARGYHDGYGGHPPQDMRLARHCGARFAQADYMKAYEVGYDEHIRLKTMNCD